ncbi:MAG: hypothetical protein ACKO6N_20280 [Myxococcota bacterium]
MPRHFHSYGPVDLSIHYGAPRLELVEDCVQQLIGIPGKEGHYFTIWSARQCGKTWLMRRAVEEIRARYGEQFYVGTLSMQGVIYPETPTETFLPESFAHRIQLSFRKPVPSVKSWAEVSRLFEKDSGYFQGPVILLIDEFDKLQQSDIDHLIGLFRDMYLERDKYWLHGLALIGVRAVMGVESPRGSPFNTQRSLRVPNLSWEEVEAMFTDYQTESGQHIEPEVVRALYDVTLGQPGLVGWLGELLTQRFNLNLLLPLSMSDWRRVLLRAMFVEPNNTMLNLIAKARGPHLNRVMELFKNPNVPFAFFDPAINYLYMNGIITETLSADERGKRNVLCRFSSPFVQRVLFDALSGEFYARRLVPAIDPLDGLEDVLTDEGLRLDKLMLRYQDALSRERAAGHDPKLGQPLRSDLRTAEASGHFHLYAWLKQVLGDVATIVPEFPTGNGKVDLHVKWQQFSYIVEVKSFRKSYLVKQDRLQTLRYAKQLGLNEALLVIFVDGVAQERLGVLASDQVIEDVHLITCPIGW